MRSTIARKEATMLNVSPAPAVPIKARCACHTSRTLPVWLVTDALTVLRERLSGALEPDQPVLTYRCRSCKQIIALSARDLFLTGD
ncbi:MAG TPA: hypothetical protein VFQ38_00160 [Longimicrobiales bacterium]|nr:hypothetical protein [Longimicrobiales bacterium]